MTIANTAVIGSEAAAVGGGIAVRATRLVEEVGVRRIAMTNLTVTGNVAHRGGGASQFLSFRPDIAITTVPPCDTAFLLLYFLALIPLSLQPP